MTGVQTCALPISGNIVGAIANEARLAGPQINGVDVRPNYSLVRLPANLPRAVIDRLSKVRVRGQALNLEASDGPPGRGPGPDSGSESLPDAARGKPKAFGKPKPYGKKPYKGGKRRD